jgi:2'-5' RNA ligase
VKRLFLGIELSPEARAEIAAVQDRLIEVATRQSVRFVRTDKLHLTLVFLGRLPEDSIADIDARCRPTCAAYGAFNLSVAGLSAYPHLQRPKVLWTGVGGDASSLVTLQANLKLMLGEYANDESDPFSPHITLARIRPGSAAVGRAVLPLVEELGDRTITDVKVTEAVLFESTPEGNYEPLLRWPLAAR